MERANSPPDRGEAVTAAQIAAGALALGLGLEPAQARLLARYCTLLLHWNRTHNLTAIDDPSQVLSHHLLDSLAIIPALEALLARSAAAESAKPAKSAKSALADGPSVRILDLGSGGGLPGIPLAIARPQWRVSLLDKVGKKVAFLNQARLELGLENVEVLHARVEQLAPLPTYDLIVARAFASLADLVAGSRHLLGARGAWAAMKGVLPQAELDALMAAEPTISIATVKLAIPLLAAERHLVLIRPSP